MSNRIRSWIVAGLAATALPGVIVFVAPAGTAGADVCVSAGRRVTVAGCADLTPNYYAPLPVDYYPPPPPPPVVSACVGYDGRWVDAAGCR